MAKQDKEAELQAQVEALTAQLNNKDQLIGALNAKVTGQRLAHEYPSEVRAIIVERMAMGLPEEDARSVAERQLMHNKALEAAAKDAKAKPETSSIAQLTAKV